MKTVTYLFFTLLVLQANAAVDGVSISNAHVVFQNQNSTIFRGKAPANKSQYQELINLGVTEFIIFKNDVKGEVEKEISQLQSMGIQRNSISHIPFLWKDITDFKSACEMTIEALQKIEVAVQDGKNLYFHCTAGEDRTGYLAGLWGLWADTYPSLKKSFNEELCARGYEAGNPNKPYRGVVSKIRETLTPTYLKMAVLLHQARTEGRGLDSALCQTEPDLQSLKISSQQYKCAAE
ncbi:hypothetical protein D3C72_1247410 [compost metagenome]